MFVIHMHRYRGVSQFMPLQSALITAYTQSRLYLDEILGSIKGVADGLQ